MISVEHLAEIQERLHKGEDIDDVFNDVYELGRADAFKEIAYSDGVKKEEFEILAYNKGRAEAIEELLKSICIGCAYLNGTKCEYKLNCPCSISQAIVIREANKVLNS